MLDGTMPDRGDDFEAVNCAKRARDRPRHSHGGPSILYTRVSLRFTLRPPYFSDIDGELFRTAIISSITALCRCDLEADHVRKHSWHRALEEADSQLALSTENTEHSVPS